MPCCVWVPLYWTYPSGLLPWHWGNHMIAPVPVKQPWRIWVNVPESAINWNNKTTTNQSTTKPFTYFMGCDLLPECLGTVTQFSYFLVLHNVHTTYVTWCLHLHILVKFHANSFSINGPLCTGDALLALCAEEMHHWAYVQRRCIIEPMCRGDALLSLCADEMHYWPYVQRRCIIDPKCKGDALLSLCAEEMHYWPHVQRRCTICPLQRRCITNHLWVKDALCLYYVWRYIT